MALVCFEVLIALVILAIGLLAVAQMQITAIKGNAFGSGMTSASSLAANTLELSLYGIAI